MAQLIFDDFNRSDGDSLGANWTENSGDFDISSNKAASTNAARATWTGTFNPASANYTVQAVVRKEGGSGGVGIIGRFQDTSNFYFLFVHTFTQTLRLHKLVGGSETTLGTYSAGQSNNTDFTIKLEMNGNAIRAYQDGVLRIAVNDTAITSAGKAGLWSDSSSAIINDFTVTGDSALDNKLVLKVNDDAGETGTGTCDTTATTYAFNSSSSNYAHLGFRFASVALAQAAVIRSAVLKVYASSMSATTSRTFVVQGEDVDDSAAFTTSSNNISGRTLTTASGTFLVSDLTDRVLNIDVTAQVQEIVDRGGWASGNDLSLIINTPSGTSVFTMNTSEGTVYTPMLEIIYGASQTSVLSPTVSGTGSFTNPDNAFSSNDTYATTTNSPTAAQIYESFNIPDLTGATIIGIRVRVEGLVSSDASRSEYTIELSGDGGTTWTTAKSSFEFTSTDSSYYYGGADAWSSDFTPSMLTNANFKVRITNSFDSASNDASIDWVNAQVFYKASTPADNNVTGSENVTISEARHIEFSIPSVCTLDQFVDDTDEFVSFGATGTGLQRLGQTFQPGTTADICNVRLKLTKVGNPTDALQVKIYSNGAGAPDTLLATSSNTISNEHLQTVTTAADFYNFQFAAGTQLTANTTYWLVVERTGSLNDTDKYGARVTFDLGGPYERGQGYYYVSNAWETIQSREGLGAGEGHLTFFTYYTSATLNVNVSDSITVSESVGRQMISYINKPENITVTESVGRQLVSFVNKSESITVTESVGRTLVNNVNKSENVTVSESVGRLLQSHISVSDSITVSEAKTAIRSHSWLFADFESKTNKWVQVSGTMSFPTGANGSTVLRIVNAASNAVEVHRDFTPSYGSNCFKDFTYIELDIDIHGQTLHGGDQSAFGFDQSGWKYVSLSSYVQQGLDGFQHLKIPIADLVTAGLNVDAVSGFMVIRFWESSSYTVDFDNIILTGAPFADYSQPAALPSIPTLGTWHIQSVDTMKWSKDTMNGQKSQTEIEDLLDVDKELGVNYVCIDVPNNEYTEYDPDVASGYKEKWLTAARNLGLKIWHRGAWCEYEAPNGLDLTEGLYDFVRLTPTGTPSRALGDAAGVLAGTDTTSWTYKTYQYIINHASFFEAGDIFTPFPEPENAGVGGATTDMFADYQTFWKFLREQVTVANEAFRQIGLGEQIYIGFWGHSGFTVGSRYDERTADAMTWLTVDHYVFNTSTMNTDLDTYFGYYGLPVIIGEWGNYNQSNADTNKTEVDAMYQVFVDNTYVKGVNYWVDVGGSHESLINNDYSRRPNSSAVEKYFRSTRIPHVTDNATVTESYDAEVFDSGLQVSVSDNITVSESVIVTVSGPQVSVSDSITVSESTNLTLVHNVNKSEGITVTESTSQVISNAQINVSDSISVSENIDVDVSAPTLEGGRDSTNLDQWSWGVRLISFN